MIAAEKDKPLKVKVCGMRSSRNIEELLSLGFVDYVGYIFYEKSPRFVADFPKISSKHNIAKVGVFVNEKVTTIKEKVHKYGLNMVQLHGNESPEYCLDLKDSGISVMKAFGVKDYEDISGINTYAGVCDYFLFDTKTIKHGGSGEQFNWSLLKKSDIPRPFFISGGLNLENISEVVKLDIPNFYGIDLNSGFEDSPGQKNIDQLKKLKEKHSYELPG